MADNLSLSTQRLTIRIGRGTLAMLVQNTGSDDIVYEPYVVRSGVSMAANLREAFKTSDLLLQAPPRVRVLLDSDVLMVPVEQFDEKSMADMHNHAFPRNEQDAIYYNVLPDLNAVAVFSMNKDLRLVLDDHFQDVRLVTAIQPVWRYMHQRSFTGVRYKLYAYFHEKRLEVFSFQQNRFKFCNSFDASKPKDAVFFLLYVWNTLQLQAEYDELHLMGDIPGENSVIDELRQYLQKVYVINPAADFNQHPVTAVKGVPYDLQTLVARGR
ncbi:MAG: DUF3822 family protein [Prevotella sp.]|nr:DUF3822 family protein [Prevotella sp.]